MKNVPATVHKNNLIRLFRSLAFLVLFIFVSTITSAQTSINELPMIGAEIFIEPGQTPQEIDLWFKRMKEAGMTITRIRLFERYIRTSDGKWDFSLFDEAYKAGEKYGIKIYGNLFPETAFTDVGGFKFPRNEQHLNAIAEYIKGLVSHFKKYESHYGWVPINEPGSGGLPKDAYTKVKFEDWKKLQPAAIYNSKGYEHFDFAEERFLTDYNTWFLNWLTEEIHKYDPGSPVHVNNHAMFQLASEYNFPEWRKFLSSLGGSAHASWHFGYFDRDQYAIAVSANSEIVRSGAGNIPWLMTELQGGTTTYSGYYSMTPSKEEISQWLWASIGTESKGAIFWCLNPRASGTEAGEWAMLDFQNKPSDRMQAATTVSNVLSKNPSLFADAKVAESGLNVLYIREAMWVEKKLQLGNSAIEGRSTGGVMKSALGYFEAVSEMGLQCNFKEIGEFDFSKDNYAGSTIILAHQISIPSRYWPHLYEFASKGGKLIIDGLSGYYDENALCIMSTGFPLEKLFGGNISEYRMVDTLFKVILTTPNLVLPAHLWQGTIVPTTGTPIGQNNKGVTAIRNKHGKGEVIWIPALAGLGGRITKDYKGIASLINTEATQSVNSALFRFQNIEPKMLMKTMQSGSSYVTVIINKSKTKKNVLLHLKRSMKPTMLFADKNGTVSNNTLNISPEETIVIQWK